MTLTVLSTSLICSFYTPSRKMGGCCHYHKQTDPESYALSINTQSAAVRLDKRDKSGGDDYESLNAVPMRFFS